MRGEERRGEERRGEGRGGEGRGGEGRIEATEWAGMLTVSIQQLSAAQPSP